MLIEKMSESLRMSNIYINSVIHSTGNYKIYEIDKKSGGKRRIFHPSRKLKVLQYWLVNNYIKQMKISDVSTAYEKGNSIIKNAALHMNNNFILHIDIEDFFNSITAEKLKPIIINNFPKFDDDDIELFCAIVMRKNHLAVGGVAAPHIANAYMYEFDEEMKEKISNKYGVCYSRYADDIYISSKTYIDNSILKTVDEFLAKYGLERNHKKTYYTGRGGRRRVTGVMLDNNIKQLTIGTQKRNEIKKLIYMYLVYGVGERDVILGNLAFLKNVNANQYEVIKNKYSKYEGKQRLFN